MKIITGDEFGLIKLISTQSKTVIDQYGTLDSSKSIINIFSNNKIEQINNSEENDEEEESETKESLNLYISSINENYILNWDSKSILSSYKNENDNVKYISSTIKFPDEKNNNTVFINGLSDSKINIVSFNEHLKFNNSSIYSPLDTSNKNLKIKLRGIANSIYNTDSVYLLYQNNPFLLYNINEQKIEFKGKNLPNDELNLRIPMHDMDIVEVKNNPRLNYISTAYGEIRLYDKKASPRPSLNKKITNSKINKIDITDDGNYLFIGDNSGYCAMLDIRKSFSPCKTFKGNSGSIQTLVNIEQNNNLIVAGFDRYVKVYDYKSGGEEKIFVKNKINSAILVGLEKNNNKEFEDDEDSEIRDSELMDEEDGEEEDSENIENGSHNQKSKSSSNKQNENEDEEENGENEDEESGNKENEEETEENKEEEDEEYNEDNIEENSSNNKESSNKNSEILEEDEENDEDNIEEDNSDNKESSNKNSEILEEDEENDEDNIEEDSSNNKESSNKNSEKLEEDEDNNEDDDENNNKNREEEEENDLNDENEEVENEEEDLENDNEDEKDSNEEDNEINEDEDNVEGNDITEEHEEFDKEEEEESEQKYNNRKRKREEKVIIKNKNKKKKLF